MIIIQIKKKFYLVIFELKSSSLKNPMKIKIFEWFCSSTIIFLNLLKSRLL